MNDLNVLVIEQMADNKELEEILIKQGIKTISIALQSLNIMQIADTIKPNVILFNSNEPSETVLQTILDINNIYAVPIILFSEDESYHTLRKLAMDRNISILPAYRGCSQWQNHWL